MKINFIDTAGIRKSEDAVENNKLNNQPQGVITMCIVRKHLPYNQKTKDKLAKLPKIYLVACWASYGTLEFPFPIKYKKVKDKDNVRKTYIAWDVR